MGNHYENRPPTAVALVTRCGKDTGVANAGTGAGTRDGRRTLMFVRGGGGGGGDEDEEDDAIVGEGVGAIAVAAADGGGGGGCGGVMVLIRVGGLDDDATLFPCDDTCTSHIGN